MIDEFHDLIDEEATDAYIEQTFAQDAREPADVEGLTHAELKIMLNGMIDAHNKAISEGDIRNSVLYYRIIRRIVESDDEIAEKVEEAQDMSPIDVLMGGGDVGGGMF